MIDRVLVTGVGGFIGQHAAAELLRHGFLLRQGFEVRGSLRNVRSADAVRAGIARAAPVDQLDLVELDLHADVGWDAAMAGRRYALHVASPYAMVEPRNASASIEAAVQGTQRALHTARNARVERVRTRAWIALSAVFLFYGPLVVLAVAAGALAFDQPIERAAV